MTIRDFCFKSTWGSATKVLRIIQVDLKLKFYNRSFPDYPPLINFHLQNSNQVMILMLEFNLQNDVLQTKPKKKLPWYLSPKNVLNKLAYFIIHQGTFILLTKKYINNDTKYLSYNIRTRSYRILNG